MDVLGGLGTTLVVVVESNAESFVQMSKMESQLRVQSCDKGRVM